MLRYWFPSNESELEFLSPAETVALIRVVEVDRGIELINLSSARRERRFFERGMTAEVAFDLRSRGTVFVVEGLREMGL